MKIKLRSIPPAGLNLHQQINPGEIDLKEDGFKSLTPLEIRSQIEKVDNAVIAKTTVVGKFELTCARCLEPIEQKLDDHFDLFFEVEPTTEFIDLGDDIRQEMIVNLSRVVLCRDDCKGLCPGCGANLNREKCKCNK